MPSSWRSTNRCAAPVDAPAPALSAEAIEGSGAALRSATGMLRSEVAKRLNLRLAPSLEFFLDAVPDSARHIEELLAKARESDADVAARAEGAQYAGEADPYKRPADEADEDDEA